MKQQLGILFGVVAVVACVSFLHNQEATAAGGDFNVDSFFDISYYVGESAEGGVDVRAAGVSREGEVSELLVDVARVVRAGEFTTLYVNHPDESLITEITTFGKEYQVTGITVLSPTKGRHNGHVTVLK